MTRKCQQDGCEVTAHYNTPGQKGAKFCGQHKGPDMRRTSVPAKCKIPGCDTQPSFGVPGKRSKTHCSAHQLPGMESKEKRCKHEGCTKQPSFGLIGQITKTHCAAHQLPNMEYKIKRPSCASPGCTNVPSFGYPNQRQITHCATHRLGWMESKQKRCAADGCHKRPRYGAVGQISSTHCAGHQLQGMESKAKKRALSDNRKPRDLPTPVLAAPLATMGLPQALALPGGMLGAPADPKGTLTVPSLGHQPTIQVMEVKMGTCSFVGCESSPTCGTAGQPMKTHCDRHMLEGMDAKDRRCATVACDKLPAFAAPGQVIKIFCAIHRPHFVTPPGDMQQQQQQQQQCLATPCQPPQPVISMALPAAAATTTTATVRATTTAPAAAAAAASAAFTQVGMGVLGAGGFSSEAPPFMQATLEVGMQPTRQSQPPPHPALPQGEGVSFETRNPQLQANQVNQVIHIDAPSQQQPRALLSHEQGQEPSAQSLPHLGGRVQPGGLLSAIPPQSHHLQAEGILASSGASSDLVSSSAATAPLHPHPIPVCTAHHQPKPYVTVVANQGGQLRGDIGDFQVEALRAGHAGVGLPGTMSVEVMQVTAGQPTATSKPVADVALAAAPASTSMVNGSELVQMTNC
ncbi:unnamed protein product [Chrysoparadoxa australica]